ncbi:MAG: hypothetical protein AAGA58_18945 [Verrucomicrobiota bacterium]
MKNSLLILTLFAFSSSASASILFSDTFSRANNDDIDADTGGMGGSLGSLNYVETTDTNSGTSSFSLIRDGQLGLANGPNASGLHIDHNFIDSAISTAGGFNVSLDLDNTGTNNGLNQFFAGFGIGLSVPELGVYNFDHNASAVSPGVRGHQNAVTANSGVADFFVGLIRTGSEPDSSVFVGIYESGVETSRFLVDDNGAGMSEGTLSVDFELFSFAAGATVVPSITVNGVAVGGAADLSFTWQAANSNYIGIAARMNNTGWNLDNLTIETIPEPTVTVLGAFGLLCLLRRHR